MAKKRIDESPLKLRGNSTGTLLLEHESDAGAGRPAKGDKMTKVLTETTSVHMTMVESAGGKYIARGEFGRVDVPTANGRIYPAQLMQREIERLSEKLANRGVVGTLDHPENGRTSLDDVSHVITSLKIKDGIIVGEAEILNTKKGKNLKALIEANVQVGVSSRGLGSTRPSNNPKMEGEIVQDDFVLKTWDFVADPAVRTAIPGIYTEDEDLEIDRPDIAEMFMSEFPEIAERLQEDAISRAKLRVDRGVDAAVEAAVKESKDKLTENFEKQLASTLMEARDDIAGDIREEYESDPNVGGSKAILAAIWEMVAPYRAEADELAMSDALKAKELEVAEAVGRADEAEDEALQIGCMYLVERKVSNHPMADSVRKMMGGQKFTSLKDANDKLAAVLADLPDDLGETGVSEEDAEIREENASLRSEIDHLNDKVGALKSKLQRAVDVGMKADSRLSDAESRVQEAEEEKEEVAARLEEALAEIGNAESRLKLESYKHKRVAGLPNGGQLLGLMEDLNSEDAVDRLVQERGVGSVSESDLTAMRKSLRRGVSEKDEMILEEHRGDSQDQVDELGNSLGHMLKLAGY